MTAGTRTVDVVIHGRVQGVGYRMWTQREAERRGLSGHVRNRPDGTVEAAMSGESAAVSRMLEACRTGPPGSGVTRIDVVERGADPLPGGFAILRG